MAPFFRRLPALILLAIFLTGCAAARDPRDPWEPVNRVTFEVNDTLDKAIVKPVAIGYKAITPDPVRTWVRNFFSNLNDVIVLANDLLQGKWVQASDDFARLFINSTWGLLGINDIATLVGLEKHDEDLGQTLAVWGLGTGPYFVIPLIGPSTVRDTVGLVGDMYMAPILDISDVSTRNLVLALRVTSIRADFLDVEKLIDEAAIDRYNFIREAYLQRRLNQVYDGNPPRVYDDEEASASPPPSAPANAEGGKAAEPRAGSGPPRETPAPAAEESLSSAAPPPGPAPLVRIWLPTPRP